MELRELEASKTFRELIESADKSAETRDRRSHAFVKHKILLVIIDRLLYGLVSKNHRKWICSCAFIRNR
jgi:hypothetical protein